MEDYVPRPEFEMFCKNVNGSLGRIEKAVEKLSGRPSWGITFGISFLSTGLATTLTLILSGVIK